MSNFDRSAAVIADRYNIILLTNPIVSPTGRFIFFFGQHYDGKQNCFDIGACDMMLPGKPTTRRHHRTKEEALVTWEETKRRLETIEQHKGPESDPIIFT